MTLSRPLTIISRIILNWIIPILIFFCTHSLLAISTQPGILVEKSCVNFVRINNHVDSLDHSCLSQRELKTELKKTKKTDSQQYKKVKREFNKPNEFGRIALILIGGMAAIVLGFLAGCAIYSSEAS